MKVYFDLNIFDRIEKKDRLTDLEKDIYNNLESLVIENKIDVPYSNAHLNDLYRGYEKNPEYVNGHLETISRLTKNLCLCQYWNQPLATWHMRDVFEFFEEKKEDREFESETFEELLSKNNLPNAALMYKLVPLDKNWKLAYSQDPMFGIMFPKSRIENNGYALIQDIYEFQHRLKTDYALYKNFKSYLAKSVLKLNNSQAYIKSIRENFKDLPKHLEIEHLSDLYAPKETVLKNKNYSNVLDIFYKLDLKGYKTDANFNNMFDDSLHTFYASHCDFFVTNDDRCKYKAEQTFEKLKIKTIVIKAHEYQKIQNYL
jgi:hypothetical protein